MANASNGFLYNPDKKEVLLHLRDGHARVYPHKWSFFGGRAEGGETPVENFVREVDEELTINIDPKDCVLLNEYFIPEENLREYSFYVISRLPKSAMKLTEGADFDWVPLDKVFTYDLAPHIKESLQIFVNKLNLV